MTRILAVIHHLDDETSAANARIAAEAGCDGVVLIEMRGRDNLIDGPSADAKKRHPNLIVVANRLSTSPVDAISRDLELGLDGSWSDDRVATSSGALPVAAEVALRLEEARRTNPAYLFFASVAFKTHEHEPSPEVAARNAAAFPWIVTTSGPATGSPPSPGKLASMAGEIGRGRLAFRDKRSQRISFIEVLTSQRFNGAFWRQFEPERLHRNRLVHSDGSVNAGAQGEKRAGAAHSRPRI